MNPSGSNLSHIAVNFAGLVEVLEANVQRLSMAIDVAHTRFLGSDAHGPNADGKASSKRQDIKLSSYRNLRVDPALKRLIRSHCRAELAVERGKVVSEVGAKYNEDDVPAYKHRVSAIYDRDEVLMAGRNNGINTLVD